MKTLCELLLVFAIIFSMSACASEEESTTSPKEEIIKVTVPDLSTMTNEEIEQWSKENNVVVEMKQD